MRVRAKLVVVITVLAAMTSVFLPPAGAQTQFTNSTPINMPALGATVPAPWPGSPYPSNIAVSGLSGTVTDVNLTLNGFDCSSTGPDFAYPEDIDMLLVGPTGANLVVLSDVGGANQVTALQFTDITLTLDDEAAAPLPVDTQLSGGTYRPTDDDDDPEEQVPVDTFPAPAPAPSTATALSVFDSTDPNGTWGLYMADDYAGPNNCVVLRGWTLEISTTAEPTTTTTAPTTTTTTTTAPTTTTTAPTTTTTAPTTTTTAPTTTTTAPTTTTTTAPTTTTTTAPTTTTTTTTTVPTTTTTVPTTTTSSTTTTTVPTTTTSSTTTTTVPTTTTSSTTTTTVPTTTTSSTTTTTVPTTTTTVPTGGLTCDGLEATVVGTEGDDRITGTDGADVIVALGGNDTIDAKGGDDVVCGGAGDDMIRGGAGVDRLFGDDGDDHLVGAAGADFNGGGPGDDLCAGGAGDSFSECERGFPTALASTRGDLPRSPASQLAAVSVLVLVAASFWRPARLRRGRASGAGSKQLD